MTAKNIPEIGELFVGYVPAVTKLMHVTVGAAASSPDVEVGSTGAYTLIDVTRPIVWLRAWTRIETAFTASVEVDVGDSGTADKLINDTTIAPATTGAVLVAAAASAVPVVYDTEQDILVTITAATVAAGLVHVYIEYAELED